MGCKNCKCKNKLNVEDYNVMKELLNSKIQRYDVINYINENEENTKSIEVQFEDYILEIDDFTSENINVDKIIEYIIKNSLVHL